VVARVSVDMLRSRQSRREEPLAPDSERTREAPIDPEADAELADSVGLALLVVLEALAPAERVAFVLHDMFDLPFEEIAPIVGRSPTAARQLASRARRRVRGATPSSDVTSHRPVVDAFLAAARAGDFDGLVAVLDPNVELHADRVAVQMGDTPELRGAAPVAALFRGRAQAARPVLVDGALGVVVAPAGRLLLVLRLTMAEAKIKAIEVIAEPERLRQLELSVPDEAG
jgi:RNA polymerase sigma-70 factor (ECF subfamily)